MMTRNRAQASLSPIDNKSRGPLSAGVRATLADETGEELEFQPHFEEYMQEAFKPLGAYINFWHPQLAAGSKHRFRVMAVNDEYDAAKGRLVLAFAPASGGNEVVRGETPFEIPPLGQMTYDFILEAPTTPGEYLLSAKAYWPARSWSPTLSRRKVSVVSA